MTVNVRWVERKGRDGRWIEYDIRGEYPDGDPYRERCKSHLSSISATERWAEQRESIIIETWKDRREKTNQAPSLADLWIEYLRSCRARRNAESTIKWKTKLYATHIEPQFGARTRVDKIDGAAIEALKISMSTAKPKSVNNVLGVVRSLLGHALKTGRLTRLPTIEMDKVPESAPKYLTPDEYARLISAALGLESERCWQPLVLCLLGGDCGLRLGEMLALQWTDIDFDRRRITLQHSYSEGVLTPTKGKRFRVVGLSESTARVLQEHKHKRTPFVFHHEQRGQKVTPRVMYRWFELAIDRAGLKTKGLVHVLRHTFGSHLAIASVDLHLIRLALGHANQRTTEIYARIAADSATSLADTLDSFRAKAGRHAGGKQ